jgi:hypothetical protein
MWWAVIGAFALGFICGFLLVGMFTASKKAEAISEAYLMAEREIAKRTKINIHGTEVETTEVPMPVHGGADGD